MNSQARLALVLCANAALACGNSGSDGDLSGSEGGRSGGAGGGDLDLVQGGAGGAGHECELLRIASFGKPNTNGGSTGSTLLRDWLGDKATSGYVDLETQIITPELLADFQVIVFLDASSIGIGRTLSDAEVAAFHDWLSKDHGVFTTSGYWNKAAVEAVNANELLSVTGINYRGENQWAGIHPITDIVHPHPVTEGVTVLGLGNGNSLEGGGTTLATETRNDVTAHWLKVADMGTAGRVVVWADEWIIDDTLWNSYPDIPAADLARFWQNAINWLRPAGQCEVPIPK